MRMNILPSRRQRDQGRNGSSVALATTLGILGLISLLLAIAEGYLAAVMIGSVIGVVGSFHYLFGAGRAFSFALANLVGTYACIFLFFAQSNFDRVDAVGLSIGFLMPLPAFVLGSLRRRGDIQKVMLARRFQDERRFARVLLWLAPVFVIGVLTFFVPRGPGTEHVQLALLLIGMALVSAIVLCVSHDVAVFLLDTELLFAAFFRRTARLIVPAFAFLSFYSLFVILFASFYSIADYAAAPNFRIDGAARALSFPETLYFSLTTLSTVGYGDISPATNLARFISAIEIVCGILLLLFGFNEIFSFAQERRQRNHPIADVPGKSAD
jgi:voltage-gated potassium channel